VGERKEFQIIVAAVSRMTGRAEATRYSILNSAGLTFQRLCDCTRDNDDHIAVRLHCYVVFDILHCVSSSPFVSKFVENAIFMMASSPIVLLLSFGERFIAHVRSLVWKARHARAMPGAFFSESAALTRI